MGFSFCSSLDPPSPLFESLHCTNTGVSFPKAFVRLGRKDNTQFVDNDMRKMTVPRQLLPKHLHGSFLGKKQPEEANLKVDFVRTLLIDNYDSYTYNIYQELSVINGVPPVVIRNDEWTWEEICYHLYVERAFDNVILSPGPGSPTDPADIGLCLQVLQECKDIPILGVCLGHQALGYVHGARIVHASEPIHGRLSEIDHNGSRLFHHIPSGRNSSLKVVRYHSLVIDEKSLPKQLVPIAWTSSDDTLSFFEPSSSVFDVNGSKVIQKNAMPSYLKDDCSLLPSDGGSLQGGRVLMGIMHSTRPHYGLQFHPESVATSYGSQMFKNFRDITLDYCQGLRSSSRKHSDACAQVPHAGQPLRSRRPEPSGFQKKEGQHYDSKNICSNSHASIRVENLKLKWKKLDGLVSQVGGAGNIFLKMYGDCEAKDTFWLDSSSVEKGRARFSFMGGRGGSLWKQLTFKLTDQSDFTSKSGGLLSVEDAQGSASSLYLDNGFLNYLNTELQSFCCDEKAYDGLPFDFCGGYIGYLGYNLKVECGARANCHYSSAPDACFFFADNFLVIDHCHGDVYVMSVHEKNTNLASWLDDTVKKLLRLKGSSVKGKNKMYSLPAVDCPFKAGFNPKKSKEQYMQDVEKCLRYIKDGESYELCLTTQMGKRLEELDPLHLYFRLREQNPAPYAAWLNFSRDNLSICCSSPERFLRLDTSGILEAKPIKGTISRGSTPEHDEQLKMRLQYSEKDQAENLMIVDLLRNDLGRVCEPGSVHVPHLMEVESYATVHTMVSTIRGIKQRNATPVDCVRAAFPGGSMTGAPKLRSMEILDSIERCSRGIYSGSIGYFSINGAFDLNIVIRTVIVHEGEASIGAGGAIVALSKPEEEYEEMILKARAPAGATIEQDTSN